MEVVKCVLSITGGVLGVAKNIVCLYDQAQSNKKQCKLLKEWVESIIWLLEVIHSHPKKYQSEALIRVLEELQQTVENAESWVIKYTGWNLWKKLLRISKIREEFEHLNGRLKNTMKKLGFLMNIETWNDSLERFDEWKNRQNEDPRASDLKELLHNEMATMADVVDGCLQQRNVDLQVMLESAIRDESLAKLGVTLIRTEDLLLKEELVETPSSIMYKGEYLKGTVAIKRFKYPLDSDTRKVTKTFEREAKVMNKFSYTNILRLYGICIDNTGEWPSYSIIMEYCAKGNLREVLKKEEELPWETRIDMCVGAARALYRLHHTGSKTVVHQRVYTTKFLVDGCYCVKLAGFELTKTESSMNRNSGTNSQDESFLAFCCPQRLASINYPYDKKCDLYSFGIVLWEIITGKIPFEGCTASEIYQKVCEERFQEALPSDCPVELKGVIDLCRAYDSSQRPSSGVVADKLAAFQNKMEQNKMEL